MKSAPAAQTGPEAVLSRKLESFAPLTEDDLQILHEIGSTTRAVPRRSDIVTEGRKYRALFLVAEGILMRYRILRDGRRQIVSLVVPGDFVGIPGCLFDNALYSVKALTDVQVSVFPLARLLGLLDTHPRLAAKLWWSFACEAALYAEHLIMVGRCTAVERVAHFLLELLARLQIVGLADESSYCVPLSQEVIGDALGLSLPYVNRVLRHLADDGLVTIREHKVVIQDLEALSALADFERAYLKPLPIAELLEGGR